MPDDPDLAQHVALAHEFLAEARHLMDGAFLRGAASAAYYAMFHAARAALLLTERDPRTHRGLVHSVREAFVQQGLLDEGYLKSLDHEQRIRQKVDYDAAPPPGEDEVEELIEDAARFVAEMERLIARLNG